MAEEASGVSLREGDGVVTVALGGATDEDDIMVRGSQRIGEQQWNEATRRVLRASRYDSALWDCGTVGEE